MPSPVLSQTQRSPPIRPSAGPAEQITWPPTDSAGPTNDLAEQPVESSHPLQPDHPQGDKGTSVEMQPGAGWLIESTGAKIGDGGLLQQVGGAQHGADADMTNAAMGIGPGAENFWAQLEAMCRTGLQAAALHSQGKSMPLQTNETLENIA